MNERFHDAIMALSHNPWVERFVRETHSIAFVSGRVILWHDDGVIRRSHDDHHGILAALLACDPAQAEDLMREHVCFAGLVLRDKFDRVQPKPGEEPA